MLRPLTRAKIWKISLREKKRIEKIEKERRGEVERTPRRMN